MAIGGGGSGGGPVGFSNSFTGPASALEIVGEHAYMYTGSVANATSETTIAETISGNFSLVGQWQVQLFDNTTDDQFFRFYLNESLVAATIVTSTKDYSPYEGIEIIIPPYTELKITSENLGSGNKNVGSIITGRIYRG